MANAGLRGRDLRPLHYFKAALSVQDCAGIDQGTLKMRLLSAFLALALSTSTTLAADLGALSPGAPAGVKHAQEVGPSMYVLVGVGVLGAAIAIISSTHSNGAPASGASGTVVGSSTTSTV